jgi:hypothetical protein
MDGVARPRLKTSETTRVNMTVAAKLEQPSEPLLQPTPSIAIRMAYFLCLWALKMGTLLGFRITRMLWPTPAELRPTIVKASPCRPHLRNRIFIPKSHKSGDILPLHLDLYGGGFANRLDILVVSIGYGTAPPNKFPGPTNDVVAIVQAAIEDESLSVDKSRVVLGGFSASGNLCLSAAQMLSLKDKIQGVMAWYPVTILLLRKQRGRPRHHIEMGNIWTI